MFVRGIGQSVMINIGFIGFIGFIGSTNRRGQIKLGTTYYRKELFSNTIVSKLYIRFISKFKEFIYLLDISYYKQFKAMVIQPNRRIP